MMSSIISETRAEAFSCAMCSKPFVRSPFSFGVTYIYPQTYPCTFLAETARHLWSVIRKRGMRRIAQVCACYTGSPSGEKEIHSENEIENEYRKEGGRVDSLSAINVTDKRRRPSVYKVQAILGRR